PKKAPQNVAKLAFWPSGCLGSQGRRWGTHVNEALDLTRPFLPEALAGLATIRTLDADDRRRLNQIRGISYLPVFDCLETCFAEAVGAQAMRDVDARDTLAPLLRLDAFDHNALFQSFEQAFPLPTSLIARPADLDRILLDAAPLSLLVVALHLK